MKLLTKNTNVAAERTEAAVFFLYSDQQTSSLGAAFRSIGSEEFSGKLSQLCLVHTQGELPAPRALLVGLGSRKELTNPKLHRAASAAARHLRRIGIQRAAFEAGNAAHAGVIAEAVVMAQYDFDDFKPSKTPPKTKLASATIHVRSSEVGEAATAVARSQIVGECVNWTKAIANLPGNVLTPAKLAAHAQDLCKEMRNRVKCRVYERRELERGGFGGLLGVGGGSVNEPRMIVLEYRGGRAGEKPFAVVGKAITFDSGGICIKPADKMDEMKWDKCGGVAVLGLLRAAALLRLHVNLVGVIAAAENLPSATCYRPGDILTTRGGKTIEVINTDAEGRVILADALAYASEQKPQAIVDFATLTGACVVALGNEIAGIMGNDAKLVQRLLRASEATGEQAWELPLRDQFRDMVKSDVATVKNSAGRYGGAISAAAFLQNFVEDKIPWAHVDIAGPAWISDAKPYHEKGATAFGVRLMLDLLTRRED